MNENGAKLVAILSHAFKIPPEQIHLESRLREDLKADSLDASVALMDIEEGFGVIVPERERAYRTVGDIHQHIEELLRARGQGGLELSAQGAPAESKTVS